MSAAAHGLKLKRVALALAALCLLSATLTHLSVYAAGEVFKLLNYSVKPLQGSDLYPGSSNVEIVVDVQYVGSLQAYNVIGCLVLPKGFTPSRGYTSCSPAYTLNGTIYEGVKPGSLARFRFHVDIARDVAPGIYVVTLNISYYVRRGNTSYAAYNSLDLFVEVKEYPKPVITVLNAYLVPRGYPGSRAELVVTLYNNCSVSIAGGKVRIVLPSGFTPAESYVDLPPLPSYSTATISVPISIQPSVRPGTYTASIYGNVTAVTPDGVDYLATFEARAFFTVNPPPEAVKVVDAGVTAAPPAKSALTRAYVTILVASPDTTVYAVEARWRIKGAYFANGSTTSLTYVSGVYSYGSHITIVSDPLIATGTSIVVHVELNVLASTGGSTFWVTVSRNITVKVEEHEPRLRVIDVHWSGGAAYPGSKGITLSVIVENDDILSIRDLTAVIQLPYKAFTPSKLVAHLKSLPAYGQAILSFAGVNVRPTAQPGIYIAVLRIHATAVLRDGSYTNVSWKVKLPIEIAAPIRPPLKVIDYTTPIGRPFRGMCLSQLNLVMDVAEPVDVVSAYISVISLSKAFFVEAPSTVITGLRYGQVAVVTLKGLCVSGNESNVRLAVIITGKAAVNNAEYNFTEITIINLPTQEPKLNISLVGFEFIPLPASNLYTANGYIQLKLLSLNPYTIRTLLVKVCLENALYMDGRRCKVFSYIQRLGYGSVSALKIGPLLVANSTSPIGAHVEIIGVVDTGAGLYTAAEEEHVYINLSRSIIGLILHSMTVRAGGEPSPLLPGQENIAIELIFVNPTPYTISTVKPVVTSMPKGLVLKDVGGTCIQGVAPGSSCTLTLVVDTSNTLRPGLYKLNMLLLQYLTIGDSITLLNRTVSIPLLVDTIERYAPRLKLLSVYWGQTPQVVYEHSGVHPLTIIVFNPGRYTVKGVYVRVRVLNETVELLDDTAPCASSLPAGSVCRAVLYANLEGTPRGLVVFNVTIGYVFSKFNSNSLLRNSNRIVMEVKGFTNRSRLILLGYGWANGWHVYPLTRNATFTVTLANQNPYSIGGVLAQIILPSGIASDYGGIAVSYVGGPIAPFEKFTLKFNINVGNVSPGSYNATLIVRYVPNVAGATMEHTVVFNNVVLEISSPQNEIEVVNTRWVGPVPNNDTKGALLEVNMRNIGFNVMKAVVAYVRLPQGVTCSINNESTAALPVYLPVQVGLKGALQAKTSRQDFAKLLKELRYSVNPAAVTPASVTITSGSLFKLLVPLNLELPAPLRFNINITLSFIDQWGVVRNVSFTVKVPPYGSARVISVSCQREVSFVNGVGIVKLNISNIGSAPIYNVYVYIVPQSPIITLGRNVFYFDTLKPGETKTVSLPVYYNPLSLQYFSCPEGGYSSVPLLVSVMYRDVSGSTLLFNASTSFKIKPFILVSLGRDIKVEYRGKMLYAGGTIENRGISKAYSVLIVLKYRNRTSSTFIGDIDPGGQSAFRVELEAPEVVKGDNATIIVFYRDAYGALHSVAQTYAIRFASYENNATITGTNGVKGSMGGYLAIVAVVAAFLAFVAAIIGRFLKKHEAKLGV